jgi:hypothetical protein
MHELLRGLPVRIENWIRSRIDQFSWRWVFYTLLIGIPFTISGIVAGGILEGKSYEIWTSSVEPFLREEATGITKGFLVLGGTVCTVGWATAAILGAAANLIYGADRRRLGQLEQVGKENAEREKIINELNKEIGQIRNEVDHIRKAGTELLALFSALDRELLSLLTRQDTFNKKMVDAYFESVCRRLFKYMRAESDHRFRASVYLPNKAKQQQLVIKWDIGVGKVSRRWNKWYIGDRDPTTLNLHRGIPGDVFMRGVARTNLDVRDDPYFHDPYKPPRSVLPYKAILHAVIHPNDLSRKCGVLCIDSLTYKFSPSDLEIAEQVAIRLGWLLYQSNVYDSVVS